jgi:WD40 repeat protein
VSVLAATRARPVSPYKGLAPFEDSELDALLFFGREREREVIAANVVAARLTVLYGPSGVGKSSVLGAGVARDLRGLPEAPLVVVHGAWAEEPAPLLAASVAAAAGIEAGSLSETIEVAAALHGDVYLLLDQVEEYFVYHGGAPALGEALAELVNRSELPVHVLLSIREDALARLDAFKARIPGLLANRLRLDHLSPGAGRRAILGPVESFGALVPEEEGLAVEPELVEAVLAGVRAGTFLQAGRGRGVARDVAAQARLETPYLQVVMQRLWEVERGAGSRVLRLSTLQRLGGPARIVEEHLERALTALTPAQKQLAARMFNHLVTPSGMKIAHGARDLAGYAAATAAELEPVLSVLGRERILRPVGGEGTEAAHEIFHDVLADAVLAWRGSFDAEQAVERERAAARRRHRRLIAITAISVAALAAMAAVTVYALSQRSEARRSAVLAGRNAEAAGRAQAVARDRAAVAETQRRLAVAAAGEASAAALEAHNQANRARRAERQAQAAEQEAERQRRVAESERAQAEAQRIEAEAQRAEAESQRGIADHERAQAEQEARAARAAELEAQRQARLAERRRAEAGAARVAAQRAALRARTRELAFNSVALLTSTPEESLALALRAAKLEPSLPLVESALRRALLATGGRRILPGGGGRVRDAAFSPDGALVVTAGGRDARIHRTASGRLVRTLATGSPVRTASFSRDGRTVVTAGRDGRALVWEAGTGQLVHSLEHGGAVTDAAFSPDGGRVVTTSTDGTASLWNAGTGVLEHRLEHEIPVNGAAFSPDGARVVTFANERTVRVFDAAAGALVLSLAQTGRVTDARFSPRGDVIATTGRDGLARLWDAGDGRLLHTLEAGGNVLSAVFSPRGGLVVTVGTDGIGHVWDVASGTLRTALVGHQTKVVGAAFSPNERWIVTAGSDRSARLWLLPAGTQLGLLLGHRAPIFSAAFSPSGTSVLTSSEDGTARVWDAEVDRPLRLLGAHEGRANALAFAPDGSVVASAGADGLVRLWSLRERTARATLAAGTPLEDVAFSADGGLVAAAGTDGNARVWRTVSGELAHELRQEGPVHAVAFFPDGSRLATAGDDATVRIRALDGGREVVLQHPDVVNDVAVGPAGMLVATASADGLARLWRAGDGRLVRTFQGHHDGLTAVSFSADGTQLVTASLDHDARVWDVATGRTVRALHGHASFVSGAAFSADGRWVVTAGPVKAGVWAVSARDLPNDRLSYLVGHEGPLTDVAFAPTGWLLATAGVDGTIRTYTCSLCGATPELVALGRQRLRGLRAASPEE